MGVAVKEGVNHTEDHALHRGSGRATPPLRVRSAKHEWSANYSIWNLSE